jgi:hypothetical protein
LVLVVPFYFVPDLNIFFNLIAEAYSFSLYLMKQAVEEKYKHCDDTLLKLLTWIGEVEDKLANQDVVQEDADELRNQINTMKVINFFLLHFQ